MTEATSCSACGTAVIPGISSCVVCGQPTDAAELSATDLEIRVVYPPGFTPMSPEDIAQYQAEAEWQRARYRRREEAQALEYAGDELSAIPLYEALIAEEVPSTRYAIDPLPFKRLAILYRRAKREADEERVVRAAITALGGTRQSWFVLRLAKIIGKRKRR